MDIGHSFSTFYNYCHAFKYVNNNSRRSSYHKVSRRHKDFDYYCNYNYSQSFRDNLRAFHDDSNRYQDDSTCFHNYNTIICDEQWIGGEDLPAMICCE
jgi:hypothetical protein